MKKLNNSLVALGFLCVLAYFVFNLALNGQNFKEELTLAFEQAKLEEEADFFDKIAKKRDIFEEQLVENIPDKKGLVNLYGGLQNIANKKVISDPRYGEIYKTKYHQLSHKVVRQNENAYLSAKKLISLAQDLKAMDIPLLYVQAPFKLAGREEQLPLNRKDYSDQNADLFLSLLKQEQVDYLDLRPLLINGSKSQNELFFNTDHHWRIETAFTATGYIEDYLNQHYGFTIDAFYHQLENYDVQVLKNVFLGSAGRRVGKYYAGVDDFSLITPKFPTDISLTEYNYGNEVRAEGSFYQAVIDHAYLRDLEDISINRYASYHGDHRELIFKNKLVNSGKVLFIKDSFAVPVYSFMSLAVGEVRALDLRLYKGALREYIKSYQPDIVIVLYNSESFSKEMFDFK